MLPIEAAHEAIQAARLVTPVTRRAHAAIGLSPDGVPVRQSTRGEDLLQEIFAEGTFLGDEVRGA